MARERGTALGGGAVDAGRRRLLGALALALGRPAFAAPVAGAAGSSGRQVVDMAGRSVAVPERIERIASAGGSPAVNAFLFLFGQGPRIVTGLPPQFAGAYWKYQRRFGPNIAHAPVVSGPPPAWAPDLEAVLRLAPDLCFVVGAEAARQLERAGLPALVLDWNRIASVDLTVRLLGEVFALPRRAQDWFDWRADLLDRIAARLAPLPPRPRVLYARMAGLTQPIMVPANHLIEQAGGRSVTAADKPLHLDVFRFSLEQLLAWDPEVLLCAFPGEVAPTLADPRLQGVAAVRAGRVYPVPRGAHIWTHYTPEQPLGVLWLARLLHPQALAGLDPAIETRTFYQRFFELTLEPEEVLDILHPGS